MTTITVRFSGPLFNGAVDRRIRKAIADSVAAVADDAMSTLHHKMNETFINPTPYYETQVVEDIAVHEIVIHDRGVIYGPWLEEGRGGTRFRGYGNWRRTTQEVKTRVPATVQRVFRQANLDG